MTSHAFSPSAAVALALASLWLGWTAPLHADESLSAGDSAQADQRPNIVVIMCDDMGFSDIGCYGGEIDTPHLDRLAKEGMRFRNFYNNAKCEHTRASLLTGHWWHHVGASSKAHYSQPTFGERMRDAGYRTLMTGKWHAGEKPFDRGFDRHFGLTDGCSNFWNPGVARKDADGNPVEPEPAKKRDVRRWAIDDQEFLPFTPPNKDFYSTDAFTDAAIDYLNEYREEPEPFVLYVAYTAPHYPLHAHQSDVEKYRHRYGKIGWDELRKRRFAKQKELGVLPEQATLSTRTPGIPAWDEVPAEQRDRFDLQMATYAAMIDCMDQNIGRLMQAIEDNGDADNTLTLFFSDNGACPETTDWSSVPGSMPWEATSFMVQGPEWACASNTPYRYYKTTNYEGGTRSPMIAHFPGVIPADSRSDFVSHLVDVVPTLLQLGGADPVAELPGRSLVPVFSPSNDKVAAPKRNQPVYWHYGKDAAIRDGDWKAFRRRHEAWKLFDLAHDPTETTDVADAHRDRVKSMAAQWQTWRDSSLDD